LLFHSVDACDQRPFVHVSYEKLSTHVEPSIDIDQTRVGDPPFVSGKSVSVELYGMTQGV
jgi:hypothetical protein